MVIMVVVCTKTNNYDQLLVNRQPTNLQTRSSPIDAAEITTELVVIRLLVVRLLVVIRLLVVCSFAGCLFVVVFAGAFVCC